MTTAQPDRRRRRSFLELATGRSSPWPVAHRGARAFAPENTLVAFAKAAALGCTMIELDVHLTRDGVAVVHHDDDLRRCTNIGTAFAGRSSFAVADIGFAELRTLDAGSWFAAEPARSHESFLQSLTADERSRFITPSDEALFASGAIHVPSLREVLSLARRADLWVDVELKPSRRQAPTLAEAVLAVVAAEGMADRVLLSSFDPDQLRRVRALSDDIAMGLLTDASLPDPVAAMDALDADALNPNVDDPRCLHDVHVALAAGRLVFPWTCNDPATLRKLVDAGATGVITDYPNRLLPNLTAR